MFKQQRLTVLSISILLALLFAAVMPMPALADDGVPPTTDTPAVVDEPVADEPVADEPVVDEPVTNEPVAEELVVDEPVAEESVAEVPVVDEPVTEELVAEEPVADEPIVEEPVTDELVTEEPAVDAPIEDLTVPEVLDAMPGDTDLVVLDASGEALPLASVAATEVLAAPDPYFTVGGTLYQFTAADCDPGLAVMACDYPIQAAINYLSTTLNAAPDDGNIYVEAGTYSENVYVDGLAWGGGTTTPLSLGLIGAGSASTMLDGWFAIQNMNAFTLSGFSVMDVNNDGNLGTPTNIHAYNNEGALQLTDLVVTNDLNGGIDVTGHIGDVALSNVTSSGNGNSGIGAYIWTTGGKLTVNDSNFSNNAGGGLAAWTHGGDITLNGVTASDNGTYGTGINTDNGSIFVNGGNFSTNSWEGLGAWAWVGNISLNNVTATDNGERGVVAFSSAGNVTVTNGNLSNNNTLGLAVNTNGGGITLNNVTVTGNEFGVEVDAAGNVIVNGGNFSNNSVNGLGAWSYTGNVTLNNVTANGNGRDGAFAHAYNGNVTVNSGNFSNNGEGGLFVNSSGVATFNNVTAVGNGSGDGYGAGAYGNLDVICGNYSDNNGYGLWLGPYDGNAYLGGPNLSGNSLGAYYLDGGTISFGLCGEGGGERGFKPQNNLLPHLPISQIVAQITPLNFDELPVGLPEAKVFVAGFTVKLLLNGKEIVKAPSGVQVAFDIPADLEAVFTVLFWNGTEWVEIPSTQVDGQVIFFVTTPGIYVLANQ